ncbi:hypothetical protein [Lentibacillus juripiscarius]|uniref:hypothetical protein n=1 Tax=Lentibacillus juripiscarius TaxID=257446 RepID=UPI0036D317A9
MRRKHYTKILANDFLTSSVMDIPVRGMILNEWNTMKLAVLFGCSDPAIFTGAIQSS